MSPLSACWPEGDGLVPAVRRVKRHVRLRLEAVRHHAARRRWPVRRLWIVPQAVVASAPVSLPVAFQGCSPSRRLSIPVTVNSLPESMLLLFPRKPPQWRRGLRVYCRVCGKRSPVSLLRRPAGRLLRWASRRSGRCGFFTVSGGTESHGTRFRDGERCVTLAEDSFPAPAAFALWWVPPLRRRFPCFVH